MIIFSCCNEMTRLMDGGKSSFPYKQLMSVAHTGRNKLNDALKAAETSEQKFYLKMSEHHCADFPSSILHRLLTMKSYICMKFMSCIKVLTCQGFYVICNAQSWSDYSEKFSPHSNTF